MGALVDQHFQAEARVDLDAIMATYASDVAFEMIGHPGGVLHNPAAIRVCYTRLFGEMTDLRRHTLRGWYGPNHLVDNSLISARASGRPFGFEGKGRPFRFRLLHVFAFAEGRIARERGW